MVTNGRMFLDVFGLYLKVLFCDEKSTSACILFTSFCGYPRSSRRNLKSRLLDSNFSLIDFVRNKCSPLKTLVSKKAARSDDISHVNLIVAWNLLAKSTKLLISCLL